MKHRPPKVSACAALHDLILFSLGLTLLSLSLITGDEGLIFELGNAEALHQFPDNQFDAYTIAFGIRNVTDRQTALEEAYRVLKPGGR